MRRWNVRGAKTGMNLVGKATLRKGKKQCRSMNAREKGLRKLKERAEPRQGLLVR